MPSARPALASTHRAAGAGRRPRFAAPRLLLAGTGAQGHWGSAWPQYMLVTAALALVSLLNFRLASWAGYQALALVYLLAVVLLALLVGRGPILLGAAMTALGWNFLFVPPRYSFHIASFYDKMMLAVYFVVALTIGELTARLRALRQIDQQREERARTLCVLTRELSDASDREDILHRIVLQTAQAFEADVALLLSGPGDSGRLSAFAASTWPLAEGERQAAVWAFEQQQPAGHGTAAFPQAEGAHFPLGVGGVRSGVLSLRPRTGEPFSHEQMGFLENFVRQIALALDRRRLHEAQIDGRLLAASEQLSRTLLSSVSHELRTPLAAIASAAHSLRASGPLIPVQARLTSEIELATARLDRLVQSLLDAARLQAGQVRPKLDWCDVADLLRVVLRETERWLAGRPVQTHLPAHLPLIKADFVLLQQALMNLLSNAATHTPPGTPIEVNVEATAKTLLIEVADRGPGLPSDQLERVFDLFHRPASAKAGGTGLGLAIVKGFVEAQGGRVAAANRPGGGARFTLELPVPPSPDLPEPTA